MIAPEPTRPAAEHTDAVARQPASIVGEFIDDAALMHACRSIGTVASFNVATDLLTSTDPAVHEALAANLPADVMLDALVRAGVLTEHTFQSFGGKWTLTLSTEPRAIDQDEALDLLRKRLTGGVAP